MALGWITLAFSACMMSGLSLTDAAESCSINWRGVGCFKDSHNRAIFPLESLDTDVLTGSYVSRLNPIRKCALAAARRGYKYFAIQNGGWCASSPIAHRTYNVYGRSSNCRGDGEGGPWANEVYRITKTDRSIPVRVKSLGCWKDTRNRAIPTLEGNDALLDGGYRGRKEAFRKCYDSARRRGFKVFALQDGGWCASSAQAQRTYKKYGRSSGCARDGEGGPWANEVYQILN